MALLTQSEVAALLRCSASKVGRLRRDGAFPFMPGRQVKVELADVLAWVDRAKIRGRAPRAPSKAAVARSAAAARGHRAAKLAALRRGVRG